MILSHIQIEEIAAAVIKDFNRFCSGGESGAEAPQGQATPVDRLAEDYLGLRVSYAPLSGDGSICGLTAYADTEFVMECAGDARSIPLKAGEVLLDSSFLEPGRDRARCGRRRFTLAHECAHQILFQMESEDVRLACGASYSKRAAYSLRDLKTREDWNEWQANALGAALLMPQGGIDFAMGQLVPGGKLTECRGWFGIWDRMALSRLCRMFGVSRSAAVIRLRQLGYIEDARAGVRI